MMILRMTERDGFSFSFCTMGCHMGDRGFRRLFHHKNVIKCQTYLRTFPMLGSGFSIWKRDVMLLHWPPFASPSGIALYLGKVSRSLLGR